MLNRREFFVTVAVREFTLVVMVFARGVRTLVNQADIIQSGHYIKYPEQMETEHGKRQERNRALVDKPVFATCRWPHLP